MVVSPLNTNIILEGKFLIVLQGLSWSDYFNAYKHQLIDVEAFVEYALWVIEHQENFDDDILLLAGESPANVASIEDLVEAIVTKSGAQPFDKEKWLYISLLCLYQKKDSESILREKIDTLYTHFDYPESIKHLVSYMPCEGELRPILSLLKEYIHSSPYSSLAKKLIDKL